MLLPHGGEGDADAGCTVTGVWGLVACVGGTATHEIPITHTHLPTHSLTNPLTHSLTTLLTHSLSSLITLTVPLSPTQTQTEMDDDAYARSRTGRAKVRSFAADPSLFPCEVRSRRRESVGGGGTEQLHRLHPAVQQLDLDSQATE